MGFNWLAVNFKLQLALHLKIKSNLIKLLPAVVEMGLHSQQSIWLIMWSSVKVVCVNAADCKVLKWRAESEKGKGDGVLDFGIYVT